MSGVYVNHLVTELFLYSAFTPRSKKVFLIMIEKGKVLFESVHDLFIRSRAKS